MGCTCAKAAAGATEEVSAVPPAVEDCSDSERAKEAAAAVAPVEPAAVPPQVGPVAVAADAPTDSDLELLKVGGGGVEVLEEPEEPELAKPKLPAEDEPDAASRLQDVVAGILAADDAGRALQAASALDALGADCGALLGEARVADIRERAGWIEQLQSHLATARAAAESGHGDWSRRTVPNIEVLYSYGRSTGIVEVIGEITVEMAAVELWTLVHEFDLGPSWLPNAQECRKLHEFSQHCELYRMSVSPPLPIFAPMVVFQERSYLDVLDEHGCLVVVVQSPETEDTNWRGVPLPPEAKGERRMKQYLRNQVRPLPGGRCKMLMHLIIESGLYHIPDFIVGKVATLSIGRMQTKLDMARHQFAQSTWKERLDTGPNAEYYRSLQARLDAVVAAGGGA